MGIKIARNLRGIHSNMANMFLEKSQKTSLNIFASQNGCKFILN